MQSGTLKSYLMVSLTSEILRKKPHRESTRDPGVMENGEMLVKEYRLLVIKRISSGSLMYSMMIIIFDNTISCT